VEVSASPASAPASPAYAERLVIRKNNRVTLLDTAAVDWIEASDYVVRIHAGAAVHVLREPIADLEKRLDPRRFFRVHRSTIVNLASVKELQPLFHGEYVVVLRDGTELRLARSRRDRLQHLLGARI
jgi:two-component system LytT family response regulator